ncbi:MAG: hypothetical protein LBJ78_04450 [Puniceicoccales bacterium]|nr:hypothetical protein [Puniceicoccales bacterium]
MSSRFLLSLMQKSFPRGMGVFPFTQGICSQLPLPIVHFLNFSEPIRSANGHSYTLRVASPQDAGLIRKVLYAYGHSNSNYKNLEFFPEEKLATIIHNMTHCLEHRYFITFVITVQDFPMERPIGFLQIDPYSLQTIDKIFNDVLFPQWNNFLTCPLREEHLGANDVNVLTTWLNEHTQEGALQQYFLHLKGAHCKSLEKVPVRWKNFVAESFRCLYALKKHLASDQFVANVSYGLLPQFQMQGIMSQAWHKVIQRLQETPIKILFSDRIALKNRASLHLLRRLNFTTSAIYQMYYSQHYHTRCHPNGMFAEPCTTLTHTLG